MIPKFPMQTLEIAQEKKEWKEQQEDDNFLIDKKNHLFSTPFI
jgi:hypothetical protein